MSTPESKQWPPSLPEKSASADAWLNMFEATRHAVEASQRVCRRALKDMSQNDLIFEIYRNTEPKQQPYKVGHGLVQEEERTHSARKILWVPNTLSINIVREGITKETRRTLARALCYNYIRECWEQHRKEGGEPDFCMNKREQYQEAEFLAYAGKMREIQPLYETLFTGRMKNDDIHLFAADNCHD